jgi:anti-sigma factor ChrR (cupin superfamily)
LLAIHVEKTKEIAMKETHVKANEIEWRVAEEYPEGTMQKMLHDGSDSAPRSVLLKIEPGWTMKEHAHVHTELHYVLEGEYESRGNVYPAGSFRVIPMHTNHGPFTTIKGATILVIWIEDGQ